MADKEIFIPSPEDYARATSEIAQDIINSRHNHRSYFYSLWRDGMQHHYSALNKLPSFMVPRDRSTGDYFEHKKDQEQAALLGFAAGALYVSRIHRISEGNGVLPREIVEVIRGLVIDPDDAPDSQADSEDEINPVDNEYSVGQLVREEGRRGLTVAGATTERVVDDWSERITPVVPAQNYFSSSVGLIIGAARHISIARAQLEHERQLEEMTQQLAGLHDFDWDQDLSRLLSGDK